MFSKTRASTYKDSTLKKFEMVPRGVGWGLMLSHLMDSVDHWLEQKGMLHFKDQFMPYRMPYNNSL